MIRPFLITDIRDPHLSDEANLPTKNVNGKWICNRCGKENRKLKAQDVTRDFNLPRAYIWLCQYCRGIETKQNSYQV
jgi:hypothetical protein